MTEYDLSAVIICAWLLDALAGDPDSLPHPVRAIGAYISWCELHARCRAKNLKAAGALIGVFVPLTVWVICSAAVSCAAYVDVRLSFAVSAVIVYTCVSTRSLGAEAYNVYAGLARDDIQAARMCLSRIVGRDTFELERDDIIRAAVETLSENTVDGIIAPLMYACIGGAPLAMAYKAVNTLDSMIGYRDEAYREIGWFSARFDDLANFIPARISVALISLACLVYQPLRVRRTLLTGMRDGRKSPSPNAGFPEACFAGTLGIQLGGTCTYKGRAAHKPVLGTAERPVQPDDILRSIRMMWYTSACTMALAAAAAYAAGWGLQLY